MTVIASKGTALQQELSMVFTAVAQLTDISRTGAESETFETTTLDTSGAGKTYAATGYSEPGSYDASGFLDPALAGHQALTDLITTPADQNWKVVHADGASTEEPFTGAGIGVDWTATMNDGLKFSMSIKTDGLPTFPT